MIFRIAIFFELLTCLRFLTLPALSVFAPWEELRILIWLAVAFSLCRGLLRRTMILFFWLSQVWTFCIFMLAETGHSCILPVPIEIWFFALSLSWLLVRSYDPPTHAVKASELTSGVYLLVHPPNPANVDDIALSAPGLPVKSVSVYVDGIVYGMHHQHGFGSIPANMVKGLSNKYAINLLADPKISKLMLDRMIGKSWRVLRNNCVSGLIPFWRMTGLRFPWFAYYIPGIFLLFVNHKRGRRV